MMKNEMNFSQKALAACFVLHEQLLNECCYNGYDGEKDDFDTLYDEVYAICRYELPDEADLEQVIETFHEYQLEQMNGDRQLGWYL